MAVKLPRAIRLDPSDTFIFDAAAEPGEWLVSGAFLFHGAAPDTLPAKVRTAFRGGFLGVRSLGWSTLGIVTEATVEERRSALATLARNFAERYGAPDMASALAAAEAELTFAESLCAHPPQTLIAVHRRVEGGEIREVFRTLKPREGKAGQGFAVFEFYETDETGDVDDGVNLADLANTGRRS